MYPYEITPVRVWYLEMTGKPEFLLSEKEGTEITLLPKPISVDEYRKYYFGVGEKWHWLDRMIMDNEELSGKINSANNEIFVLKSYNKDAGYCEIVSEENCSEIKYFGLFPGFIGKGLGKYFLKWAIQKAWSYNSIKKIELNTCSLDHPDALSIYKSCGFKEVKTQMEERKTGLH